MSKSLLTPEGETKLLKELDSLEKVDRPAVIQAVSSAREHGDLKENAEYQTARERQSFIEGRIAFLRSILSGAEVINFSNKSAPSEVLFGTWANLLDLDLNKNINVRLVGEYEADIASGLLSIKSPIGAALIGGKVGDVVEVQTPQGAKTYEIVKIWY